MSDILKNKLYNYEETPPASAWEKILLSLNEQSLLKKSTVTEIYNQEEVPPANTWNNISNTLDTEFQETKFKNDVLDQEVAPPPFTWNKIAAALDDQQQDSISKKILEYEVTPPVQAWEKITAVLDTDEKNVPVVPLRKPYTKILRITAAAAIIGIIAWIGFSVLENGKTNNDNSLAGNDPKTTQQPTTPVVTPNKPSPTEDINNDQPTTGTGNQLAFVNPVPQKQKITKDPINKQGKNIVAIPETDTHATSEEFAVSGKNIHKKNKPATQSGDNKTEPRYLVYLTEQGEMVKLSKKLADLKCIYTKEGSVSQESLAKLDASECNGQLKYWQEKMANSSLQSSSNPLELIEVLK